MGHRTEESLRDLIREDYPGAARRLIIWGSPIEKFAIQSHTAHQT